MIEAFDAAIFDMDGTILDSLGVWEKIDHDFLEKKRGIAVPPDYVHAISAMSFAEIAEYTIKRFNLSETPDALMQEWTDMAAYEYANNIRVKPFVREYIQKIRGMGKKVALCTSSPRDFYEPAVKSNGIYDLFDAFANTCEAGVGKNSPRVYLLAAQKLGVAPEKCLVFEDVAAAAECAKKTGMAVCGVYDERSRMHRERLKEICDYYIDGFDDVV